MAEIKRLSLVKPTLETPFHIDFQWWSKNDRNWRVYLHNCLCEQHQKSFGAMDTENQIDWVDPETAEIIQVDGLQQVLINHCAKQEGFITHQTTLVEAIFRLLLANGNTPLTPIELSQQLGRDANKILQMLSGPQVYKGLRPCLK